MRLRILSCAAFFAAVALACLASAPPTPSTEKADATAEVYRIGMLRLEVARNTSRVHAECDNPRLHLVRKGEWLLFTGPAGTYTIRTAEDFDGGTAERQPARHRYCVRIVGPGEGVPEAKPE